MPFTPKSWGNFLTGGTPLTGAALIDLETRLSNYTDSASGSGLGLFNVVAYGAVGNGIANDTTPIANAAADAALVGGVVFFPPGTYLSDFNVPDGISVWGSGPESSILLGTLTSIGSSTQYRDMKIGATGARQFFSSNATDIVFQNCWLFGGNNQGIIYLNDTSVTNVQFIDCEISGNTSTGNGVAIIDKGTVAKHFENITFTRCWFHGNDRMNFECIMREDVGFPNVLGYRNISLYDCIFDGTTGMINVSYDSPPLNDLSRRGSGYSTVRGCKITGGATCLELAGPEHMLIEGNIVTGPVTGDILSMSQYGTAASEKHIARIVGNEFRGGAGTSNVTLGGGGVVFSGNDIETSGALRLNACNFCSITGNVVETTGFTCISLEAAANNTITGNQFRGGSSQTMLFIYAGTQNNQVIGNAVDTPNSGWTFSTGASRQYIAHSSDLYAAHNYTERVQQINAVTYSASMTPDNESMMQKIVVTDAVNMAINAPPAADLGYLLMFDIFNNTALPMGTITWNAVYKLIGGATGLPSPAAGKHRTISFYTIDGTTWIETSRAAADI